MNLRSTRRGRQVLFALLYLSEGAPIGYLWWAMPTRLKEAGMPPEQIGVYTGLIALPWALKFLWAPLVDRARGPRFPLRSWILTAQAVMALSLVPLLFLDFGQDYPLILTCLLVHAFAAATQDVAIDALAIGCTRAEERGALNGAMQVGMLTGRAMLGGGALILASHIGDTAVLALLLVAILGPGAVLLGLAERADPPRESDADPPIWPALKRILSDRTTLTGLAFALLAGAGFEAVGVTAGPYLKERGVSTESIGAFFASASVIGLAVGAVIGGRIADRIGVVRATRALLLVLTATILALFALDVASAPARQILFGLTLVYFAIGLFTAASYALFMDLSHGALAATRFSAFMATTNLCESWSSYAAGRLIPRLGYSETFAVLAVIAIVALLFIPKPRESES